MLAAALQGPQADRSNGFVLAMILVSLLVISMLGIASVQTSRFQGAMAKNQSLQFVTFQNAESVALQGESHWHTALLDCLELVSACDDAVLRGLEPPEHDGLDGVTGVRQFDWREGVVTQVGDFGSYLVEFLGQRRVPGDDRKRIHLYRITARGLDHSGHHMAHLQTIYRICMNVDGSRCPD